jgi:hypothetical protein
MWDQEGPLGGSVEHSEGKNEESALAIPVFLCGSPCLCRLRTEGLVPVSKFWTYRSHAGVYGPSKPSSLSSTDVWLKPTTSLVGLGEKLRWVPRTTQPSWEVVSGALFLESSSISPTLLMTHKRLLYMDHVRYVWSRAIHGLSVECVWRIGRVFLYMVYIDSNHCDSWIWVTACSWLSSSSKLLD